MKVLCDIKEVLRQEQNDFREDNLLKELIKRCVKDKLVRYFAFLDFDKAYKVDSILCKILRGVGFSDKIVNIIKDMTYTKTIC